MNNAIKVLLVDHGGAHLTFSVISCLSIARKYELHVLSFGPQPNPFYRASKNIKSYKHFYEAGFDVDFEAILEQVRKLNIDIVVPVMERSVLTISYRLAELKAITHVPPVPDPDTFDTAIDKWLLYNWLNEHQFSRINPYILADVLDGKVNSDQLSYPFLIKPFWGSDGNGIIPVKNKDEFEKINIDKISNKEETLIQPFVNGDDIDISFLADKGEILAYVVQSSLAQEKNFKYSRNIQFLENNALVERTSQIVKTLNYSGIAHLDFKFDAENSNFELVDFNCRYWGSLLGSLNAGINFPDLACQLALGNNISEQKYTRSHYYETVNIFRLFKNFLFTKSLKVPQFSNSLFIYFLKDLNSFVRYMFYRVSSKVKHLYR